MPDKLLNIVCPELKRTAEGLRSLNGQAPHAVARGLSAWGELTLTECRRRTPVDTGALRGSENLKLEQSGAVVKLTLGAGGPAAPYAVHVHENLKTKHPVGEAKYMENPINERMPLLDQAIAREVDKVIAEAMRR